MHKSVTYTFICQQGELETMASLLLASLHNKITSDDEIIIGIPKPFSVMGEPSQFTLDFCKSFNAQLLHFTNELFLESQTKYDIKWRHQLLANKIYLLHNILSQKDYVVFLDSDQIMVDNFSIDESWMHTPVSARLVGGMGAKAMHSAYIDLYRLARVPVPTKLMKQSFNGEEFEIPFSANTGFIALENTVKNIITAKWLELYKKTVTSSILENNYFSEQSIFVPAVASEGYSCHFIQHDPIIHYNTLEKIDTLEKNIQAKVIRDDLYRTYPELVTIKNTVDSHSK